MSFSAWKCFFVAPTHRFVRFARATYCSFCFLFLLVIGVTLVCEGQQPPSDPRAVSLASQSVAALTGGNTISDVTLTGSVTWIAGADTENGTATLLALGSGESRMNLALPSGTRTEIRDASMGIAQGQWMAQDGSSGLFASQNCWTDAVWFFPVLGSLAGGTNVVFLYIGQESWNGQPVQHIQSYLYQSIQTSTPSPQQLSAMDYYLDATTLLPLATAFNTHPDNNAGTNISVEIDFSNYQAANGTKIPGRIQKYVQGTLVIDMAISGVSFNTGLPLSDFAIN